MENIEPLVSIVICNYNYGRYIRSAIESALNQTYNNIEVIVVDDGSTDDSRRVIKEYESRVKVIFKENGGQCDAYNVGFVNSKGVYVCFLDSDDLYSEDMVSESVRAIEEKYGSKVHFKMGLINPFGERVSGETPKFLSNGECSKDLISKGYLYSSAPGSGNFYRRTAIQYLFPLPVSIFDKHGADFYTIYGSSLMGNVIALNKTLGLYRVQSKEKEKKSIVFGNAAKVGNELERHEKRSIALLEHIKQSTNQEVVLPRYLYSFSTEKVFLALKVLGCNSYYERVLVGFGRFRYFIRGVFSSKEVRFYLKLILIFYAVFMIVAPYSVSKRMARYLCNAASRG